MDSEGCGVGEIHSDYNLIESSEGEVRAFDKKNQG